MRRITAVVNIATHDCICQGAFRTSLPGKPLQKSFRPPSFPGIPPIPPSVLSTRAWVKLSDPFVVTVLGTGEKRCHAFTGRVSRVVLSTEASQPIAGGRLDRVIHILGSALNPLKAD